MIAQWHDPATQPLPAYGTQMLTYHVDLGLQVGVVMRWHDNDAGESTKAVDTELAILPDSDSGWWWAFAPQPPEGAES